MTKNNNRMQRSPMVKRTNTREIANEVRKAMLKLAEGKISSVSATGGTISVVGGVAPLTAQIGQGDDLSNRSGDKIMVTWLKLYVRFTAITTSQTARFILFRDRFNQGGTPTVGEVLPGLTWQSSYADTRVMQQRRFAILMDHTIDANINGEAVVSFERKFTNLGNVFYLGAAGGVTGFSGPGSLFLLIIGSAATGLVDYNVQLKYNDS